MSDLDNIIDIESKQDPNDEIDEIDEILPTFTRRMSSQLSRRMSIDRQTSILDQTGVGDMIPEGITNYIPGLGRHKIQQLKATYFCNICFTKYPIDQGFTLRQCQHQFCIECIKEFCTNKILNGMVYLKCFYPMDDKPCSQIIQQQDIQQLVDQDIFEKYDKFKSNLENTLSRQCPYCDNTQIGDKSTNIIKCNNIKCGKEYCLYHSNAHLMTELCESYELRTAKENKMNEMAIKELGDNVRPCPKCNFRIIKNGGCNHMKCVKCGCSFCWICMEEIEDVELPSHYKDENSKCKGQQFVGMENENNPPLLIILLMILCIIIFCIPGLIFGCLFGCICHPCIILCCYDNDRNLIQTITICSIIWIMIPVIIILSIFILIWSIIKTIYDNIQSICTCLPSCNSWIDHIHDNDHNFN